MFDSEMYGRSVEAAVFRSLRRTTDYATPGTPRSSRKKARFHVGGDGFAQQVVTDF
jgi:hypothetical protein